MDNITRLLKQRTDSGRLRTLPVLNSEGIDFISNDYLGLARNIDLRRQVLQILQENSHRPLFGSTGSRLVSGNLPEFEETEHFLATYFNSEAALLFQSGFQANQALMSALPQKSDLVLYDSEIHASIKTSLRLSNAVIRSFRHNDLSDLKKKVSTVSGHVYVVVESTYSISGDKAPLAEMLKYCTENEFRLVVDEAHSLGVAGNEGKGLCMDVGSEGHFFARIYTFGKAIGCAGAAIACDEPLKQFLINFSVPFVYTTAMLPAQVFAIRKHLEYMSLHPEFRLHLQENTAYFEQMAQKFGLDRYFGNFSHILNMKFDSEKQCVEAVDFLKSVNINAKAMLPPTVSEGQQAIRFIVHSFNTKKEIEIFFHNIKKLFNFTVV